MKKKSSKKPLVAARRVSLKYHFPDASTVGISGSFTSWHEAGVALIPVGDGYWAIDLELAPGRHEFRLLVNGAWTDVPYAVETVENPFGSRNAVLIIEPAS